MNCQDVLDFLAEYLEGNLPWWRRWLFNLHLTCCGPCRRYLESYRETLRLCQGSMTPEKLAEPLPEELVQAVMATMPRDKNSDDAPPSPS